MESYKPSAPDIVSNRISAPRRLSIHPHPLVLYGKWNHMNQQPYFCSKTALNSSTSSCIVRKMESYEPSAPDIVSNRISAPRRLSIHPHPLVLYGKWNHINQVRLTLLATVFLLKTALNSSTSSCIVRKMESYKPSAPDIVSNRISAQTALNSSTSSCIVRKMESYEPSAPDIVSNRISAPRRLSIHPHPLVLYGKWSYEPSAPDIVSIFLKTALNSSTSSCIVRKMESYEPSAPDIVSNRISAPRRLSIHPHPLVLYGKWNHMNQVRLTLLATVFLLQDGSQFIHILLYCTENGII
ncbi:hypothetical protein J6590_012641 [Homalodisca vitripennis]|nr:hypothetical protein J6590_012641 [Homalodisca vitripennis]